MTRRNIDFEITNDVINTTDDRRTLTIKINDTGNARINTALEIGQTEPNNIIGWNFPQSFTARQVDDGVDEKVRDKINQVIREWHDTNEPTQGNLHRVTRRRNLDTDDL